MNLPRVWSVARSVARMQQNGEYRLNIARSPPSDALWRSTQAPCLIPHAVRVGGDHFAPKNLMIQKVRAPMNPAAGIVSTQAQTIWLAMPQRTADSRRVAPTPTIEPVMAWVVETGIPKCVAVKMAMAAPVSAANPPTG